MKEAIKRLKEMLRWSDRIGSDEIFEIQEIIKIMDNVKLKIKKIC